MDFEVQVANSVTEIGEEAWDLLGKGHPYSSYRWYLFGEAILKDDLPIYIILSRAGEPIARGTFWLVGQKRKIHPDAKVGYLIGEIISKRWPFLVCRTPVVSHQGFILPSDPELNKKALEALIVAAKQQAKQYHVSFIVFDRLAQATTTWNSWEKEFVPYKFSILGTRMDIAWDNFENYIQHLSQKTRHSYRRICRSAEENGVQIKYHPTVTRLEEALPLMQNVTQRHRSKPPAWMSDLLEHINMVESTWITAEIGDRLVGCELLFGDGHCRSVTALGIDYSVPNVYFLLGYSDIRLSIETGIKVLQWGSMAYETKERLGFQRDPDNYILFSGTQPLVHGMGKLLSKLA